MNKVILIGNLASEPEKQVTQSGISKCSFRLAVQRRYAAQGGERIADFLNIVCWRNTADFAAKYLTKGRRIALEGTIQTRSWDGQDGAKHYITEIIADIIEPQGARNDGETQTAQTEKAAPAGKPTEAERQVGYTEVEDDELPF